MSWHQHLHNYTSAFYLLQTTLERPYAPLVVTWNKHSDQSQKRGTENNAAFVIANKARKTVTLAWVNKRPHNSRWLPPGPLPKIAAIVWKTGFNTCLSRQSCKQRHVFCELESMKLPKLALVSHLHKMLLSFTHSFPESLWHHFQVCCVQPDLVLEFWVLSTTRIWLPSLLC